MMRRRKEKVTNSDLEILTIILNLRFCVVLLYTPLKECIRGSVSELSGQLCGHLACATHEHMGY
jgi:hypothetical protein